MITPEPVQPPDAPPYNEEAQYEYQRLVALTTKDPERAISQLEEARARYPEQRQLSNALTVAHLYAGHHNEAYRVAEETYRRFPNYLFAKVNYASQCLERGEIDKVAEILDGKFDLKLLYPERDAFHMSEFVGYTALIGRYFLAIGEIRSAVAAYKVLSEMAPEADQTLDLEARINRAVASATELPFPPMDL